MWEEYRFACLFPVPGQGTRLQPRHIPRLGIKPALCGMIPNQMSHTGQDSSNIFQNPVSFTYIIFVLEISPIIKISGFRRCDKSDLIKTYLVRCLHISMLLWRRLGRVNLIKMTLKELKIAWYDRLYRYIEKNILCICLNAKPPLLCIVFQYFTL